MIHSESLRLVPTTDQITVNSYWTDTRYSENQSKANQTQHCKIK